MSTHPGWAPIGLTVYSRCQHLKATVQALASNELADESELYIFSDAPKPGDEDAVAEVRKFVRQISGFRNVHVIERTRNGRIDNNSAGISKLLQEYGRVIWMAEDIVTAPGFLAFMNEALEFYAKYDRIVSICGYAPPIAIPDTYDYDAFSLRRFCGWGFATWESKFDYWDIYNAPVMTNKDIERRLSENGRDVVDMVRRVENKELDALDVKLMYHQAVYDKYTIYPCESLVQNIGFDGSGLHCPTTTRFQHLTLSPKSGSFKFPLGIDPDREIKRRNRKFRNRGFEGTIPAWLVNAVRIIRHGIARRSLAQQGLPKQQ